MKKVPPRDAEGYLASPEDCNEAIAAELSGEEDIELSDAYWPILRFMRTHYYNNVVASDVRLVVDHLAHENGHNKKQAKKLVFDLFLYGYVKQVCKIAGMKNRAWSTG